MKTKKDGKLRRWNNKLLKAAQVLMKIPGGNGAERKVQAGVTGTLEQ